jgi:signal transduction histidine kinase
MSATSGRDATELRDLHAAFQTFTTATASLEEQYRRLEGQVRRLRAELAEKQRALTASIERQRCLESQALRQSRLAAMGEMAATLAHEVRNPLGAMELFVRLLGDEVRDRPSAYRLVERVTGGIADLDHLVTNILDYTRLPEPQRTSTDLEMVLDEVLLVATPCLSPEIRIERTRTSGRLWSVDRRLLQQALLNLVRNAVEAMAGRGTLRLAIEPAERWVRIVVADTGPGLAPDAVEAVFAPFHTTKEQGTGLGLAVARAAVAAHGGTLAIRPSRVGATFVVTLPGLAERDTAPTHEHEGSRHDGP